MAAQDEPDGLRIELLRSGVFPLFKQGRSAHQSRARLGKVSMQTGQGDGGLSGMFSPAPDRGHQPGAAGDRLAARTQNYRPALTDPSAWLRS